MTTTAAISLFRVQVRILATPLGIIGICFFCALIPVDILRASVGAALTVCCLLIGPILFGAEYEEGARDYITTRPISQSFVFTAKVLVIAVISLAISPILFYAGPGIVMVFFGGIVRSVGYTIGILGVWAVVFDIILIGSLATVLTKDRVRGLLFGLSTLLPVVWFLPIINRWFFGDTYTADTAFLQRIHLKDIATVMSPLLVLPLLSMVYRRQLHGRLQFQPIALISISFFIFCLFLFRWSLADEMKFEYDNSYTRSAALGWDAENHIYARPNPANIDDSLFRENSDSDIIVKEDWSYIAPKVMEVIILPRFLPLDSKKAYLSTVTEMGPDILASYQLKKDWLGKNCIVHYSQDASGKYANKKVFFDTAYRAGFHETSNDEIFLRANLQPAPWSSTTPDTSLLRYNLSNGETTAVTESFSMPGSVLELLQSESLPWGDFVRNYISTKYFDGKPDWDNPRDNREFAGTRILNQFVGNFSIKWDSSFDFDLGDEQRFLLNDPAPLEYWEDDGLAVVDVSDSENPQIHRISIPWKLDGVHRLFSKAFLIDYAPLRPTQLARFGLDPIGPRADSYFATIGGGYLALWFPNLRRVAVWRVGDGTDPSFVGTSNTYFLQPSNFLPQGNAKHFSRVAPIQREDGALGYVFDNGILWLEFPALMKEAKGS